MPSIIIYILIGLAGGVMSGLIGVGGGIAMIPLMAYFLGLSQHQAQGTTLALMVPPIGLLAAWTYYREGYVDLTIAAFACIGFFFGGLFGAKIAAFIPQDVLRRVFGAALLLVSLHMIFFRR
jgi:uncharacterized membrane protein YfcA